MIFGSDRFCTTAGDSLEIGRVMASRTVAAVLPLVRVVMAVETTFAKDGERQVARCRRKLLPLGDGEPGALRRVTAMTA